MKKILAFLTIAALLFSLGGLAFAAAAEIPGAYILADMDDGSGRDQTELLSTMAALGMAAALTIEEDGSGVFDLFGETYALQFDFEAMTVTEDDSIIPFSFEDGVLFFDDGETRFSFTKGALETRKISAVSDSFTLVGMTDADGRDISEEPDLPAEPGRGAALLVYPDGCAELDFFGERVELRFDFDAMTAASEGEVVPFTWEDGRLILADTEGGALIFQQDDPGLFGPYAMTLLIRDGEDLTELVNLLRTMEMPSRLVIGEDGSCRFELFGQLLECSFDFEAMTITIEGETLPCTYAYGHLRVGGVNSSMEFVRVPAEEG